jgi:uncharacterized protein YjbI with pentapeptide repeats
MANQQTFEFIKQQLVDEWNLFRQVHPDEAIDLSGADLSDANLRGALLMHANLSRSDLCGANLREAIITSDQLNQAQPLDDCL